MRVSVRAETPYLQLNKTASSDEVWLEGTTLGRDELTVTLTATGMGDPIISFNAQDTVFVMDSSYSMGASDPNFLRVQACKEYVSSMVAPDRASVVSFSSAAYLVNDHHLTSDFDQVQSDLETIGYQGRTNLEAAISLANDELITYGVPSKMRMQILLTDGYPDPPENNVTMDTINQTVDNNITIFTIGLGDDHDSELLKWIAARTNGSYYFAQNASDLLDIYSDISRQFKNFTAASDPNINDDKPMFRDVLPKWVHVVNGSFTLEPDAIVKFDENYTYLEWNLSSLNIGEVWTVSYNVTISKAGMLDLHPYPFSRALYETGGDEYLVPFPQLLVMVLSPATFQLVPPPPPPPPPPVPPPPPPGGYPVLAPPPATPTLVPLAPPTSLPAGAAPLVFPVEYLIAGFVGLGIAERVRLRRLVTAKQKVAVGV